MTTLSIDNSYTATEVRDSFAKVCDQVCTNHENILVKRTGKSDRDVVVMSLEDFHGIQETLYLLSSQANAKRLFNSMEQIETGAGLHADPRKK